MDNEVRPQRRGRRIAMTPDELDDFLATERTCRVATYGADGPHATPLWFCWHNGNLWLYSLTRSQRWADLQADPRIGLVVDAGVEYTELRGAEITGTVETVGEIPRTGEPVEELRMVEEKYGAKYGAMAYDARHAWLKVVPGKIASWDFRKLPAG